jgi:hypothetical protein
MYRKLPTKPKPQKRRKQLREREKDWSALEDDFRTFLLMPGGSESILQQFTA